MVKVMMSPTSYSEMMAETSEVWRTPMPFIWVTMSPTWMPLASASEPGVTALTYRPSGISK